MKNLFNIFTFLFISISIVFSQESQSMSKQYQIKGSNTLKGTKKSISKRYEIVENKENLLRTDIKSYDERGNRIELIYYRPDSSNYRKFNYEFDSNSNQTLLISYDKKGSALSRRELKYDEYNNNIETIFWERGSFSNRYYREYENNKLLKTTTFRDTVVTEMVYQYDTKGRRISEMTYKNGKLIYKILTDFGDYE